MSAQLIALPLYRWSLYLRRGGEQLTASMLVDAWVAGLRSGGVKAGQAKVWTRGAKFSYPTVLPFVIEFECPYGHRTEDRRRLGTVRLIVEDDGWVTLDVESTCASCDAAAVESWLLTCPRCEAGIEDVWHHRTHGLELIFARVRDSATPGYFGSTAPLSFVLDQFEKMGQLAEARWWSEHTDEAVAQYYRDSGQTPSEVVSSYLAEKLAHSRKIIARAMRQSAKVVGKSPKPAWTKETAAEWLDQRKTETGAMLVLENAGQRDMWRAIDSIEGRPPKNIAEQAQTLRKQRKAQ